MSEGDDELVKVTHKVPKSVRDQAQERSEFGEMSDLVRDTYQRKAKPNDVTDRDEIDRRLQELRTERDELRLELRKETERIEAEIDNKETQIARLEERKDSARSKSDQFRGELNQLVSHVESGGHIWDTYPGVVDAAETIDETTEYVLEKVKQQAEGVDESQFSEGDVNGGRR